jgi:hypothetical protein
MDEFEQFLKQQPLREVPPAWRREILAAAAKPEVLPPWWREWLWLSPSALALAVCVTLWLLRPHQPNSFSLTTVLPPSTTSTSALWRIRHKSIYPVTVIDTSTGDSTNYPAQRITGAQTETNGLTRAEIDAYLKLKNRGADSLITAYSLTDDTNFLREAAMKYPLDPHVQLAVLSADLFPENRWHWLEAFKQSAPDNPIANYLAACEYFDAGQSDQAINELTEAGGKPVLETYWLDMMQARADAYASAGFAAADAAWAGYMDTPWPWMKDLNHIAADLTSLAAQTRKNGDVQQADALVTVGMSYGHRIATGDPSQLVTYQLRGLIIQRNLLGSLDPSVPVEFDGTTQ